ncbi:MAG: PQQ-binding-like beta-propeller repeat protein [Planctomycetaceae bacterium]
MMSLLPTERIALIVLSGCFWAAGRSPELVGAEVWPQFRGPQGAARSDSPRKLPDRLGVDTRVVWKVALPPGHSSPVLSADHVYLTAVKDRQLVTLAVDRGTGTRLWEAVASYDKLEAIHRIGSHAQASPVTDGERVISFFGSCGLLCYDRQGQLLWRKPMGPFNNDFGAAISPLISGDRVILCQDHDTGSFLESIDKRTGRTIWRTDRSEFPRNYCTPVIVTVAGRKQIVVAATLRVVAYDFESGREVWTVRGIARAACCSPAIDRDGTLYIASYAGGGEPGARIRVPEFTEVATARDTNQNGTLEADELEEGGPIRRRFSQVDRDKTGTITRGEYEYFRKLFAKSRNVVVAITPGGHGDVTRSRVTWESTKFVPFIASPVAVNGHVFTVKDGGILTSFDAATGQPVLTKRLPATGNYYSAPVAGDGKLYLINERGQMTVVRALGTWSVISKSEFGESVYATPAIADGQIYVRTSGHLYCFGRDES